MFNTAASYMNLFMTLALFLLCVYRYSTDRHRAAMGWAYATGLLLIFSAVRIVFHSRGETGSQVIFLTSVLHFYLGILSVYATLFMVNDTLPKGMLGLLSAVALSVPFYSYFAVEYIKDPFWIFTPSQILVGVGQVYCAYLILRYVDLKNKSTRFKNGVVLFCAGMLAMGLVSLLYVLSFNFTTLDVPVQIVSAISKLVLSIALILLFF